MTTLSAALAYSEDPAGPLSAHNAWEEGKDFRVINPPLDWPGGTYFSKRDSNTLKELGITTIAVRIQPQRNRSRIYNIDL